MNLHPERVQNTARHSILTILLLITITRALAIGQTATAGPSSDIAARIHELQHLLQIQAQQLAAQQKQIDALDAALRGVHRSPSPAPASRPGTARTTSAPVSPSSALAAQESEAARLQRLEAQVKAIGPFHFGGDFRFREEAFAGGPSDRSKVLNRLRYRLRLHATARLNQDFSGGFALATGDVNDPISTNQTASEFYTRKPFNLDRAYLNYNPHQFDNFTLSVGKFAYPFYRTELTWDKDLNPEGMAQTLAFHPTSAGPLRNLALVGFELPFSEAAGVSLHDRSVIQSAVYGGQVQTEWRLASWARLAAYTAYYDYHNADPIALALQTASAKNPQSPLSGLAPLNRQSFVQNSVVVTKAADIVTIQGTAYKTGVTRISNAQFASKFGLLDTIIRLDLKTRSERWPVTLLGDFVQNTRACANGSNIRPVPVNTSTEVFSQLANAPCDAHQRRGYWLEGRVGRLAKAGDYQLAYTRLFIEREAVMSGFNYSVLNQGSNVSGHRVQVEYNLQQDVALALTGLFSRPLVNVGSPKQPFLSRLQLDVIYTF